MLSYLVKCPHCGKPVVVEKNVSNVQCPYCGNDFDAKAERKNAFEKEEQNSVTQIRALMEEGRFDDARIMAREVASSSNNKAKYFAMILECDLMRHHPFFFDRDVIARDVEAIMDLPDCSDYIATEGEGFRKACFDALRRFCEKVCDHLKKHKDFVGERYDAVRRFIYVGECCLSLSKMGVECEGLAKECADGIIQTCTGKNGEVYNMPLPLYEKASSTCAALSEAFRFPASVKLQDNPTRAPQPKAETLCPVCGKPLSWFKASFMTCPSCKHRISKEKAINAELIQDPLSYQEKLVKALQRNTLSNAQELTSILLERDPNNSDYALAKLIVCRNAITPIRLMTKDFVRYFEIASKGNPDGLSGQLADSAKHFKSIHAILAEYKEIEHGPSLALLKLLERFVAFLSK